MSAYIAAGVLLAARRVCEQAPAARVVVLALTPRGDRGLDWPAKTMHSWPCKRAPRPARGAAQSEARSDVRRAEREQSRAYQRCCRVDAGARARNAWL